MNLQYPTEEPCISLDKEVQLKRKHNHAGRPPRIDYSQKFSPGSRHKGTIVKHLKDDDGNVYAMLVALVERKVSGRIRIRDLDAVHPDLFDRAYGVGTPLDVRIRSYAGPKKIDLHI
jgi:ribosomal protein S1